MTKGHTDPAPVTTHRGYDIRYGINEEVWNCEALGLSAEKLSTLKGKIDRTIRQFNEEGIDVIAVGRSGYRATGDIVKLVRAHWRKEQKYNVESKRYDYVPVLKVDVYGDIHGKNRLSPNRPASDYAPNTAETDRMISEWLRLQEVAIRARQAADDYLETIPRLTEADVTDFLPKD